MFAVDWPTLIRTYLHSHRDMRSLSGQFLIATVIGSALGGEAGCLRYASNSEG